MKFYSHPPSDENLMLLLWFEMYRIVSGVLNFDKEFTKICSYKKISTVDQENKKSHKKSIFSHPICHITLWSEYLNFVHEFYWAFYLPKPAKIWFKWKNKQTFMYPSSSFYNFQPKSGHTAMTLRQRLDFLISSKH